MDAEQLTFILDGVAYRINSHIWIDHPERVGLITVEQVQETIRQPDFQEDESERITHFWKWFDDIGSGNYLKVVVRARPEIHLVVTAHPDGSQRNYEERER